MKIAILLLAIIGFSFAAAATSESGLCLELDVKVYSSIEPKSQSFGIDMRKIKLANFKERKESFDSNSHIPLQEAGLVLEKDEKTALMDGHHKYLRNSNTQVWMPYAYAGEWYRNGYIISNQMTRMSTSKTVRPFVSFEFSYDPDLKNITEQDMDQVLDALRRNTVKRQSIRRSLKNSILKNQNAYLIAKKDYEIVKKNNADLKKQIEAAEKQLKEIIKKIEVLDSSIKKTTEERVKAIEKKATAETNLNTVTDNLKIETEILVQFEKELADFKPQPTDALEGELKQYLIKMSFPQNKPDEFKKEFAIHMIADKVNKSYETCNNKRENAEPCHKETKNTSKRLPARRRFF